MLPKVIYLRRGDSDEVDFEFLSKTGAPITPDQISNAFFTVKSNVSLPDSSALIQKTFVGGGIVNTDPVAGIYTVIIDAADTLLAQTGRHTYYWDIQVIASDGDVRTLAEGTMHITPDVTRRII
jgi:hypothetical protein